MSVSDWCARSDDLFKGTSLKIVYSEADKVNE